MARWQSPAISLEDWTWKAMDGYDQWLGRSSSRSRHQYSHHGTILSIVTRKQEPGMVKPEIRGNVNFEIKSQFMQELREETFSGNKNEDAHDHVDQVLSIVDRLTPGVVNTWDLLKKAFIQRYCPPSKSAKRLEEIYNFKREINESLYQAWERFNDLLYKMTPTQALTAIQTMANHFQKWHDGILSRSLSSSNTNGLVAIVSKLDNLGRDMKKLKENVHAIQVGCQICEGPHLDKECSLNEEVKKVKEAKYGEFGRSASFNRNNEVEYHVGSQGYYTRTDNQTYSGAKRPNMIKTINKYMEEAVKRQAE
uniref:Retrotransposon gag domain-containing protein n=1 Tax=Tanacetum cinerariifolium TaxID=118510 RepID=A0A6L2KLQ7_TANCI|nr:hypothetical protein [Tanacetum cinerariifolium]